MLSEEVWLLTEVERVAIYSGGGKNREGSVNRAESVFTYNFTRLEEDPGSSSEASTVLVLV